MQKIILYYKFTPLKDPQAIMLWQKSLASSLDLKGRIIISKDGINGTLGGDIKNLKTYIKSNKQLASFKDISYKWSDGNGQSDFPKLSVRVRDEIVTFNALSELKVSEKGVIGGGRKLKPKHLHDLLASNKDVVFFDGRNKYEATVGHFKNAVTAEVRTAKDFIPILDSGKYDELKDKTVVTYCTGGIRCEVLSMLMKNRGFKDVYQLDGGIVKYGQEFGDQGYWQGSLFVFDGRLGVKFSSNSEDVGKCIHCQTKTSNYLNCALKSCNNLALVCKNCQKQPSKLYHSIDCRRLDQLAASPLPA
ncbi:MAG: oxygen-dependent tRNA uridine(34) hydroxylase TrhO [Candidatus Saccharimonadales bacterium]